MHAIAIEAALEAEQAGKLHGKLNSVHEAYGVILEELDEFWDEVRKKRENRSLASMRKELIQIAAMAIRTIHDLQLPADLQQCPVRFCKFPQGGCRVLDGTVAALDKIEAEKLIATAAPS
jgi:hypothetical protein